MTNLSYSNIAYATTQNFLDVIKNNVVSVTTPNAKTGSNDTHTIKFYKTRYNDEELTTKSSYPCIILELAQVPEEKLTFRQKQTTGSIDIQIHSTNSMATAKFVDLIKKVIEDNEDTFSSYGIYNIVRTDSDSDIQTRNGFKDHWASQTFSFEFEFDYGE